MQVSEKPRPRLRLSPLTLLLGLQNFHHTHVLDLPLQALTGADLVVRPLDELAFWVFGFCR